MRVNGRQHNTACHWPSQNKWIRNYRVVISEVSSHAEEPETYLEADKARDTGRAIKLLSLLWRPHCWSPKMYKEKLNFVFLLAGLFASHGVHVYWRNLRLLFITITSGPYSVQRNVCWTATALMFSFLTLSVESLVSTTWSIRYMFIRPATYVIRCTPCVSTWTERWFPTSQLLQHPPDIPVTLKRQRQYFLLKTSDHTFTTRCKTPQKAP